MNRAIPRSWDAIEIRCVANGWMVNQAHDARMGAVSMDGMRVYDDIAALTMVVNEWAVAKWDRAD